MNVTHDLIAAVTGPGWKFGLSRILINDEDQGVVFIAGSQEPFAEFVVQHITTSRGAGTTEAGDLKWRRRGSSCQYKLAKCKISTETMTQWWEDALAGEDEEPVPDVEDVPSGSAATVLEWVGDDAERARAALDAESASDKPRVGLTRDLEKMLL